MDGTSFYDLVSNLQAFRTPLLIGMLLLPVATWVGGTIAKRVSEATAAKFLSVPIYLAVVPGTCCTLVVAYLLLIARVNILREIDLLLCAGPIISMIVTLVVISKIASFDDIPGFDRLSGLIIMVSVAFTIVYILSRLRFFVVFFASFTTLIILFVILLIILNVGLSKLKGKR